MNVEELENKIDELKRKIYFKEKYIYENCDRWRDLEMDKKLEVENRNLTRLAIECDDLEKELYKLRFFSKDGVEGE